MSPSDIGKGEIAAGTVAGGGAIEVTTHGLSRAAAKAGDMLQSIFGGLPWTMSPDAIVHAVTSGLPDVVPLLMEVPV